MPSEEGRSKLCIWSSGLHDAMRCGDESPSEYYYCKIYGMEMLDPSERVCGT